MVREGEAKGFQGYFALNHVNLSGKQDLFGQLWKEYAFSDSRYLTSDPFVLCMETVTAVNPLFQSQSITGQAETVYIRSAGVPCLSLLH